MKKRMVSLLLAVLLAATILPVQAWGATVVASGECGDKGDNVTWVLDSNGLLTISGEGKMGDYLPFHTAPWYKARTSVKKVRIEYGVSSIGNYVFKDCSSLVSITIPSSVTFLGAYSFSYCTNLTNSSIPDSITYIASNAFIGCKKLQSFQVTQENQYYTSMDGVLYSKDKSTLICYPAGSTISDYSIPNGVTSIKSEAFRQCTYLTHIFIPNSVTSIGDMAFDDCSNLKSISISSNVSSIEEYTFSRTGIISISIPGSVSIINAQAFEWCTDLTEVILFNGVSSIGDLAFYSCSSLTSITIPSSVTSIAFSAFYGCNNLTDIYYTGSEADWNAIQIGGNNTPLTTATIHYNSPSPSPGDDSEPSTIYNKEPTDLALTVYENKKESNIRETDYRLSSGAAVSCGSVNEATDKNGQISQSYFGGAVTISKKGYVSRTISEAALKVNPTVWLQKESKEYPVISAVWMDDVKDIMNAESFLPLVQSESHAVRAEVSWGSSSMKSLILAQGTTTVNISDSGNTDIKWSDQFDLSREILVVATNAAGKTASRALKLKAGSEAMNKLDGYTFGCGDTLGFTLPDDIPIAGGLKMKLGVYSPVPVCYSIEDGKVYLAIGYQADADDDPNSTSGIKEYVDAAKVLKKTFSDAKDSIDSHKKLRSAMKAFKGKTAVRKGSWGVDCGFSIVGFSEGYYDKDYNLHWLDGGVVISANGGISYNQPFVIWGVPCYAEAAFSSEAQAKLNLLIAEAAKKITPNGVISGEVSLDIGAGSGIKGLATFGGGATGKLSAETTYASHVVSAAQVRFRLDGYLKLTAFCFEKKLPIELIDKVIWEYPDYSSHAALAGEALGEDMGDTFYSAVYNTDSYRQPDLDYLSSGSPFLANGGSGGMLRAARAVSVDSVTPFLRNAYQNAAPQLLCLPDGTILAVWTGYDSTRSGMNALCLLYSRYDGSGWSEPTVLDPDGTMDCGFTLREINGEACVVWENASSVIGASEDLTTVASKMSISFARYTDGAFVTEDLSGSGGADMMPDVCAAGDGVSVVWLRNSNNDLFANDGSNEILCRTLRDGEWSEETVLYRNLDSIDSLAAGVSNGALQVAYSMDTDKDITTSADMEVYIGGSAATDDAVIDSGVRYENGQFYWYKDGALVSGGSEMVPAASGLRSDRYQVVEGSGYTAVLFTQANGVYASLYGIFRDTASGTWGEPVALTDGSDCIQSFSAVPTADGLRVIVNRLTVTDAESSEDPYGTAQMDILDLSLGCDLAVEDVYCDMQYYMAGSKLPMTVTVSNRGRQAVEQVRIAFLTEDGTELGGETLNVSLPAGVTQEIETGFTVGEVVQGQKITVQVTPVDNTDLDESSNAFVLTLQQQDMALENMSWGRNSDGNAVIYADVVNRGYTASGELTVSLRKGSADGASVTSATVSSLDTLGLQRVSLETAYEEGAVYFLTLDNCEDDSNANNSDFVVLRTNASDGGKTVSGTVSAVGLPEGEAVSLTLMQEDMICSETTSVNGSFTFQHVSAGAYTLLAVRDGYVSHAYQITVGENGLDNVAVQLVQRGDVNGAVSSMGKAVDASDMQCLYELLTAGSCESRIDDPKYLETVADINGDGKSDVYDLQRLYEHISGIKEF